MGGSDLSFSMLIRLMDGWSGPADKVRQSMRNMAQGARDMRREMGRKIKSGFSADEVEAALSRSERRISEARGRLMGAAAMAVTLGAPVIQAGNFQEKLIDFANLAEIDRERVIQLKEELNALRALTGQSNTQLLEGLATYVGKGMDLDAALAALPATGRAAKATKSQFDEMANSGYAVMDNLGVAPDMLRQAFDIMAKSGKEGSFELAAMARKFPEITAGAKSLKMDGVDAVASLSAALQIAMKSAGSEDQAATNMTNFLGKITAPDTVRKFRKFGVDVEKEMRIALERGTDPLEHMLLVIKEMTNGDAFKMGELFADKQVLDFLRAMIPNMEEYQRIKAEALGADGVIDADYERVMQGFNEEFRQLKNSVSALLGASGALLPIFTDIMREVRFGVEAVSAWTAANPELTATIVKGTAALLAFGIATRMVGFGFAVMQGGILRTAALFLKFDKAGKNVSIMGRSLRFAGRAGGFLFRRLSDVARLASMPFRWARFIPRFAWRSVITPLRWAAFLPKFAWRGLISPLRWAALLPKLSWRMLIPALRWGLRFIPVIGWAALAGELLWHLLIKPLGWDKYIPELSWESFMGLFTWENALTFLDWSTWLLPIRWLDFIPGFKWKDILSKLNWRKFIPRFRWRQRLRELNWQDLVKAISWGLFLPGRGLIAAWKALKGKVLWDWIVGKINWPDWLTFDALRDAWKNLGEAVTWDKMIKAVIWAPFLPFAALSSTWKGLKGFANWTGLIDEIDWPHWLTGEGISAAWKELKPSISWGDVLDTVEWGVLLPVAGFVKAWKLLKNTTLWKEVIDPIDWTNWFSFNWKDKLPYWDWWKIIGGPIVWAGKLAFNWKDVLPTWNWGDIIPELNLANLQGKHAAEDAVMNQGSVHGQHVAPRMTDEQMREEGRRTASVEPDQAARIAAMLERNATLNGQVIKDALTPLTQAIREGKERSLAPEASPRPEARPEPKAYEAVQPNVTVESTFESNPTIDVNVQVSMPISITRVQKVDNRAIAARAGRDAGAATERAVRRSLDDAANVE